jgi:predicted ester cyclase
MVYHSVESQTERTNGSPITQATRATIDLSATDVALSRTFEDLPDVRVEVERTITTPSDHAIIAVHASDCDHDTITTALDADGDITAYTFLTDLADGWLIQVEWVDQVRQRFQQLVAEEATLQAMVGYDGQWSIQILVPDREALARVYERYADASFTIAINRITSLDRD